MNNVKVLYGMLGLLAATWGKCSEPVEIAYGDGLKKWTPEVSIGLRIIQDTTPKTGPWPSSTDADFIVPSPDGHYFFFLFHHGVLDRDSNDYELRVYDFT